MTLTKTEKRWLQEIQTGRYHFEEAEHFHHYAENRTLRSLVDKKYARFVAPRNGYSYVQITTHGRKELHESEMTPRSKETLEKRRRTLQLKKESYA